MNQSLYRKGIQGISALTFVFVCAGNCYARPDMTPLGPNIADKGSTFYHFSTRTFDSADGKRHYKVWTGVPDKHSPKAGFPILYMLDGNAVMDRLSDSFLKKLSEGSPPVLVVIGYQTTLPFDLQARTYDYTPTHFISRWDRHGRSVGGSTAFRHLVEETIAPASEKNLKINPAQRGLWGHSYGGLFVLDSWLSSNFFRSYYTASPSLDRVNNEMLAQITATSGEAFSHKRLDIMEGDDDEKRPQASAAPDRLRALRQAVETLRSNGVAATYSLFPGLPHGAMFTASFQATLLQMSEEK
ncbi:alpha/beta hydrolase [Pantoea phytobeneficialis]|uniref:Alpha/beta hydrolase-fold protein n=1 Tax=Pantoea phytobeneficialis TaxID=2052056 RepID=A0AAP9HAZ3_9GAMM|nr:alpha/beta hydrolase-fold protein [Pantoea phytobeneficialis]MDO6407426.1 alpha/beta hydrolase-fold protein [Pantoea phytobeneficialis]QGR09526.1 Salmochelin siderophore protein IroE [Pantoea phytobeneficialis]